MKTKDKRGYTGITAIIILCMIALGIYYFSNTSKRTLEKQILAMEGMTVNLNFENAIAVYDGIDSTYRSSNRKKLILYVDSTSCSGCFLGHLKDYNQISDSLSAHNGELVAVLHPQRVRLEELKERMGQERFPFWCILDVNGEFISHNPNIPDNKLLHTFMLDENNNVILIGDPTINSRIEELFYSELLK